MDTTPPDREFCARGEQLYVEAQLDLACWRRSYPQIEHLKAAVADRELAVDSHSPLGLRVAIAQAARFHHEGVSSSRECVLCLEMTLNILTHIHVKPWNVHAKRALADLRRAAMLFAEGEGHAQAQRRIRIDGELAGRDLGFLVVDLGIVAPPARQI